MLVRIIFVCILFNLLTTLNSYGDDKKYKFPFLNPDIPVEKRVDDLVSRMTLEEKISQMMNSSDSIPRLGIPHYDWWSEGLHGVARAGIATVFPQAIGLAAMWNDKTMFEVADAISTEFRAKFHDFQRKGDTGINKGLTVWSPNINIFRDPRWGRGQETYGEDPYLTSRMGIAFVKGLQGSDPKYFKTIATPKHYAVHSGPESLRHTFDAVTNYRDFAETYIPAFRATIFDAKAYSIMGAYQRYLGVPCCASELLLEEVLREQWKFDGFVVSDCGAIDDIYATHKYVKTPAEAAALAVKAGCDLECGQAYRFLKEAVEKGLITEKEIDVSVKRLFTARMKLGLFDPPEMVRYAGIPITKNDSKEHKDLALKAARESMVLLKNNGILPLKKDLKKIAVIGPNANDVEVLYGNYNGISSSPVTILQGLKNKVEKTTEILFTRGCGLYDESPILNSLPEGALSYDGKAGLKGEYFDNMNLEGEPFATKVDKQIDFNFEEENPAEGMKSFNFSVRWTGQMFVPETKEYYLGLTGDDGYRLYIDDKLLINKWIP